MTTHVNTLEKTRKLSEFIDYYEVCNRAEGRSPKTISWYSANLKNFRNYLKNRHLPDSLDNIDTKLLREYVLYLLLPRTLQSAEMRRLRYGPRSSAFSTLTSSG